MSKSINKVILIGNLGNDPDMRYTATGSAIANINLATSDSWQDKASGERQERTEWHRVVFFNRLAEVVGEYLRKGSKVYVEGRLQTRKWQDKNGQDRWTTEIVGNDMAMLDGRSDQANYSPAPNANNNSQSYAAPQQQQQQAPSAPAPNNSPAANADFDDDIPF